jgi:uncharacterized membrane protein
VKDALERLTLAIALAVETGAALLIALGALQAVWGAVHVLLRPERHKTGERWRIMQRFATWLLLALEFMLAADVVHTAIAPTWNQIGQLAAIATIRTGLNYFLSHDVRELNEREARLADQPPPNAG